MVRSPRPNSPVRPRSRVAARLSDLALALWRLELGAYLSAWRTARILAPSGLFDSHWYLRGNPDQTLEAHGALEHWVRLGCAQGRDPHPLFDTSWYLERNPQVAAAGINPLLHFLQSGAVERRDPHPLFDISWYLEHNPGVARTGINPLRHFLQQGAAATPDPHPLFDAGWYLSQYPEVAAVGGNPLVHYLERGAREGKNPHPLFDTDWYLTRNPEIAGTGINPLIHYLRRGAEGGSDPHPLFRTAWYLRQFPEPPSPKLNPLIHFITQGAAAGRNPCPLFDVRWYLRRYPEVAGNAGNPLVDFLSAGVRQRRDPGPQFDSGLYLAIHPEVAAAGQNPLVHHLEACDRDSNIGLDAYVPPRLDGLDRRLLARTERAALRIVAERAAAALRPRPLISFVLPVRQQEFGGLRPLIESLRAQYYGHWELHLVRLEAAKDPDPGLVATAMEREQRIKLHEMDGGDRSTSVLKAMLASVRGAYLCLLDPDGSLLPEALAELVRVLNSQPRLDILYSDQTYAGEKPDWSPLLLCAFPYLGRLVLLRTELVHRADDLDASFGAAWEHELLLRIGAQAQGIGHLRRHLYRRAESRSGVASQPPTFAPPTMSRISALANRLVPAPGGWIATPSPTGAGYLELLPAASPSATCLGIWINPDPIAHGAETLSEVLETAPKNRLQLKALQVSQEEAAGDVPAARYIASDLIRLATESGCDFIAAIDPGIQIETPDWADRLAAFAVLPGVGIVTGTLLDPQGRIAEAGLVLDGDAGLAPGSAGWDPESSRCPIQVHCTREVPAVSGALAVLSLEVLTEIGGVFPLFSGGGFSWTDLALRAGAGGRFNLVCPRVSARRRIRADSGGGGRHLDRELFRDRWRSRLIADAERELVVTGIAGTASGPQGGGAT